MKNKLLILTLILLTSSCAFGWTNRYPSLNGTRYHYNNSYRNNYYNPYGSYYNRSPYYRYNNLNNSIIRNMNKIRLRNRIRNNLFSLFNRNNNNYFGTRVYKGAYYPNNSYNNGFLTGYSTPINSSALNLIPNYNNNIKNSTYYNPTNNMKLMQNPLSGQEFYFNDGRFFKDLRGIDSSTGVKIIYD